MRHSLGLVFILCATMLRAQETSDDHPGASQESRALKATEFAIPGSPAFNMLNANTPSRVERYASLHNVKVDWSLTNGQAGYTLSPGLAIEVQPVWLLFFDRAAAARYRRASPFVRTLSTLSLSAGTNGSNNQNWLAWAAKINLYREHDPPDDPKFLREVEKATKGAKDTLQLKMREFNQTRDVDTGAFLLQPMINVNCLMR